MANGGVHRLENIQTEEVSMVDRAANKRTFLVVKREEGTTMLESNGRGGFTRVTKAAEETEEEKAAKAAAAAKAFPPGAKAPPFGGKPKGDGDGDEDDKAKAKKAADDEAEKAKKAAGASTADGDDEEAEKKKKEAKKAIAKANEIYVDAISKGESLESVADAHKAMTDLVEQHKAMFENEEEKKKRLAKAGAKMSGARKEIFQKAVDSLNALLAELMEAPGSAAEHKPQAGDPQMRQPNAVKRDASDPVVKAAQEAIEVAKKAQSDADEARAELKKLQKSIPAGNAGTPQGTKVAKAADEVFWPIDMNSDAADVTKRDKSTSFLDEDL